MRSLGERLGVDPMAVYRHFRDKEALLDAMVDEALGDFQPPDPELGDARARLWLMAREFRGALLAHPGMSRRVAMNRPAVGPHTLGLAESTLALLEELGLDAEEGIQAFYAIVRGIAGFVSIEELMREGSGSEDEWRREMTAAYGAVPRERYPHVRRMAESLETASLDGEYEYLIGLLLDALVGRAGTGPPR
jgi:AcrR family transcriptional regulator